MLPYGTLWKLDQMLHPAGPPQRRTVAMRRRQALFLFLWGVLLVTVFLFPYHYASLRRLRVEGARRVRGDSAPQIDAAGLKKAQTAALARLTQRMATRAGDDAATAEATAVGGKDTAALVAAARFHHDFVTVFHHHADTVVQLRGMFDHPLLRSLAGAGSGRLWRQLSHETLSTAAGQRPTLAEGAAKAIRDGAVDHGVCLAALRRDALLARLQASAALQRDGVDGLIQSVSAAVQSVGVLRPVTVSSSRAADTNSSGAMNLPPIEAALAHLLLWIADHDSSNPEEAVADAVAGCAASMSHSLQVSFEWQPVENSQPPRTKLRTAVKKVAEPQPLYVCLCTGPAPARAAALAATASEAASAPGLFLVDPRQSGGAVPSTCAVACGAS